MQVRRVGLAIGRRRATGVILGPQDDVLARATLPAEVELAGTVAALLDQLGDHDAVSRVVIATSALTRSLHRPDACGRVGVLRIGAPACAAVPPFTQWPAALASAVRGPTEMVRGGHGYDGRAAAELDVAAVEEFGRRCRGAVAAVAITAVHAQASRVHEEQAAVMLGDLLGPDVALVTGSDDGGLGLLERENTAVLDAALAPAAQRALDGIAALMAARGLPDELYVMRGDGTVFPAQAAARRPLRTLGALQVRIPSPIDGRPQESGRLVEVLGIRTHLRELRVTKAPVHVAGAPAAVEYAAAVGAALGEAAGSIDRIFWLGERSRHDAIAQARALAEQAAIRAGADPRRLRVPAVHEALMTYVPASCIRIRVQAVGPVLTLGTAGGADAP